jgi:hypothetical protein
VVFMFGPKTSSRVRLVKFMFGPISSSRVRLVIFMFGPNSSSRARLAKVREGVKAHLFGPLSARRCRLFGFEFRRVKWYGKKLSDLNSIALLAERVSLSKGSFASSGGNFNK